MREQSELRRPGGLPGRLLRASGAGLALACVLGGCAAGNPARDNYYAARNTVLSANAGDGTLTALQADGQSSLLTRFADASDTSGR